MTNRVGRVLIIAGSDSGGGAGIQGDIKTVTCLGGYASTAITALTAQNTRGVFGIHPVPPAFIAQQIDLVLSDIGADCLKTGMLHSTEVIMTVADIISADELRRAIPLVLDPVMVAKGGSALLEPAAIDALRTRLIPRARLLTPNLPEASLLIGTPIATVAQMYAAIPALRQLGADAVLLKGGHLEDQRICDLLITAEDVIRYDDMRIESSNTHGTGCTLASAIACGLAQQLSLPEAVARARAYVRAAIASAPGLGHGHGPLWHQAQPI